MAEIDLSARQQYSLRIIQLWLDCIDLSHEARKLYLRGEYENEMNYEFIARLTRLWGELKPKVQNRTELSKELVERFMSFESDYLDCKNIVQDPDRINALEQVICEALEKLGLTRFEEIK